MQKWVKQKEEELFKLKNKWLQTAHEYTESKHWNAFTCQSGTWTAFHYS